MYSVTISLCLNGCANYYGSIGRNYRASRRAVYRPLNDFITDSHSFDALSRSDLVQSKNTATQKDGHGFRPNEGIGAAEGPVLIIQSDDSDRSLGSGCRRATNRSAPSPGRSLIGRSGAAAAGPPVESEGLLGRRNQPGGALSVCRVEWCGALLCSDGPAECLPS